MNSSLLATSKEFMSWDPTYPVLKRESESELMLDNGSRILVIPGTEKSARGYSRPRVLVLDEASRIPDVVYKSGVRPRLTDNPDCELFIISTPNGKQGFFYDAYTASKRWERYEIRSPWQVDPMDSWHLREYISEEEYQAKMRKQGILSWFSPRHFNQEEQEDNLEAMGKQQYQQEYCCEFVEQEDMVFSYEDIERAFSQTCPGIDFDIADIPTIPGMGFDEAVSL